MGRDSSVGIATRYCLDGPKMEYRWWQDFPRPARPALGSTQPPIQWVRGHSRGVKRRGSVNNTHHLVTRSKKE
jgi:hypothetical protein